jgi:hypothetical protein
MAQGVCVSAVGSWRVSVYVSVIVCGYEIWPILYRHSLGDRNNTVNEAKCLA